MQDHPFEGNGPAFSLKEKVQIDICIHLSASLVNGGTKLSSG